MLERDGVLGRNFTHRELAHRVNEFYKKGCQEKSSPSIGGREDLVSRSSPLSVSAHRFRSRGFALACLPFLEVSSSVMTTPIEF
jgi:hypothetical protein